MAIEEINLATWDEFIQFVRPGDGTPMDPVYRGHGDASYKLVAPSDRATAEHMKNMRIEPHTEKSIGKGNREGQIGAFKSYCKGMPDIDIRELDDKEIRALARHHGLVSDLLDWSSSPFIAAFFAFTDALDRSNNYRLTGGQIGSYAIEGPTGKVAVWQLSCGDWLSVEDELEFFESRSHQNRWQKAQKGFFTRLISDDHLFLESYLSDNGSSVRLKKITINANQAGVALSDLNRMNINYATLFPDYKGAVLQANLGNAIRTLGFM